LSTIVMALAGQLFSQIRHAMQAIGQTSLAFFPLSRFSHAIKTVWLFGAMLISFRGQALMHFSQARHLILSTIARPSSVIVIASKGHTRAQLPSPKQP
jgi:hypothetical protein